MGLIRPIQNNFAGLAGHHHFKCLGELGVVKTVGDDGGNIKAGANHTAHFIPSFEHFSAIDPLENQTLENHLVPVDGDFFGKDPKQGDFRAVGRMFENVVQA